MGMSMVAHSQVIFCYSFWVMYLTLKLHLIWSIPKLTSYGKGWNVVVSWLFSLGNGRFCLRVLKLVRLIDMAMDDFRFLLFLQMRCLMVATTVMGYTFMFFLKLNYLQGWSWGDSTWSSVCVGMQWWWSPAMRVLMAKKLELLLICNVDMRS